MRAPKLNLVGSAVFENIETGEVDLCIFRSLDQNCREYYPQNIMYDKRVHRGNSYAAMVIPAGTNHDTMIMEKRQNATIKKRTFKPGDRVS